MHKKDLEIKHLRELLVEKEELIEAQAELVMVLDRERRILTTNRFGAIVLGYAKALLIGRNFADLICYEGKRKIEEAFERALFGKPVRNLEIEMIKKNKRSIVVSLDLTPLRPVTDEKRTDRLVALGRDITRQNKLVRELTSAKKEVDELYQELREAYRELKETQDELVGQEKLAATGELAAGVAHEVRNPLSIINMSVQYIHGKLAADDSLREFTEAVIEKVNRLDRITKELIQYGRPREPDFQTVDLHTVIDSSLRLAAARCRDQGVMVHREYARHLPPVRIDAERMDEVFSNIIQNALDVMKEEGRLTIRTSGDWDERRVTVEIRNTGKGIPPKKREKLFTPFFTTKPDGTGLGLPICRRIVSQHHGTISVDSKISGKNKGTRFIIALPMDSEDKGLPSHGKAEEVLVSQKLASDVPR